MLDMTVLADEIAAIVGDEVERATSPLVAANKALTEANATLIDRIAALEARELILPPVAEIDMDAVRAIVSETVSAAFATVPIPQDGKNVDIAEVKALVDEAVAAIPTPKDGADCDMAEVERMVAEQVTAAVSALPSAENGQKGDAGEPGPQGEKGETGPAGKDGSDGRDGIGLADALIDRDGALVLTMTDGTMRNLGVVVGKDGLPGADGKDGATFTLDDFDIVPLDDERSFKFCFTHGETMHSFEFSFPVAIYRGVWREQAYVKGDMVTWGGSLFHCDKDTTAKPGTDDWTLAAKKGRDGKDAAK